MTTPCARHTCIPLSAPNEWKRALAGVPHAFGHTWGSCSAMALSTGFPTFLYTYEEGNTRVVCAIAERRIGAAVDIVTPYGFSGFAGNRPSPEFPSRWRAFAAERGYVCGYIGVNPLFYDGSYGDPGEMFPYNSLFILDLTQDESTLFAALATNRKRALGAAARQGWEPLQEPEPLKQFFRERCVAFLRSRGSAEAYEFSQETLASLASLDNVLFLGAGAPDRVEAVSVFAYTPFSAEYLFGLSLPEGQRYSAPLIWDGALRLKALGVPALNLGGGIRPGDGVAEFKARFGGREVSLGALKQVYDDEAFVRLCRAAGQDPSGRSGYFPPYRAPGLSAAAH